ASRESLREPVHQCAAHAPRRGSAAMKRLSNAALLLGTLLSGTAFAADPIVIGGKIFTESYILGEMAAQTIEASSQVPVTRKLGMGSTGILFEGLKSGAIDL